MDRHAAEQAVGQPLARIVGAAAHARLAPELAAGALGGRPLYLGTITLENSAHFDVLAHLWDGLGIDEFERVERSQPADFRHHYPWSAISSPRQTSLPRSRP